MRPEKKTNPPTPPPKKNWRFFFKQKKNHGVSPGVSVYPFPQDGVRPIQVTHAFRPEQRAWTGVVTSVAVAMLQRQLVDAVLCVGAGVTGKTLGTETDFGTKCGRSLGMWGSETHVITEFVAFGRVVAGTKHVLMKKDGGGIRWKF